MNVVGLFSKRKESVLTEVLNLTMHNINFELSLAMNVAMKREQIYDLPIFSHLIDILFQKTEIVVLLDATPELLLKILDLLKA